MKKVVELRNRRELKNFLQKDIFLHIFSLGDLDDSFWKDTKCFAMMNKNKIESIIEIYNGLDIPLVTGLERKNVFQLKKLYEEIFDKLPERFYGTSNVGFAKIFSKKFKVKPYGKHFRMGLTNKNLMKKIDTSNVIQLTKKHLQKIYDLYKISKGGEWFYPHLLNSKQYFGIEKDNQLISIAGVHVSSEKFKVAAIGNIATHPAFRNLGLALKTVAKLCTSLLKKVNHIGLNVKTDNIYAIKCYKKLGFEIITPYEEFTCTKI